MAGLYKPGLGYKPGISQAYRVNRARRFKRQRLLRNVTARISRPPSGTLKAYDTPVTQVNLDNVTGSFILLNNMVEGADLFSRVGRKIWMTNIRIRAEIVQNVNVAHAAQDYMRTILVYDSQPNAAVTTVASLLKDCNTGASTSIFSEINLDNRERFTFLKDDWMMLPSMITNANADLSNTGWWDPVKSGAIDWFVPLKNLTATYNGTNAGTIADITSGALYLFVMSLNTDHSWQTNWHFRLRYRDT